MLGENFETTLEILWQQSLEKRGEVHSSKDAFSIISCQFVVEKQLLRKENFLYFSPKCTDSQFMWQDENERFANWYKHG